MQQAKASAGIVSGISHYVRDGILVVELTGRAGPTLLKEHLRNHFRVWARHHRMLYNLLEWDVGSLTPESFLSLHADFAPVAERRGTGRAALLIPAHLEELARILIVLYETNNIPVQFKYFFDRSSAEKWLRRDSTERDARS